MNKAVSDQIAKNPTQFNIAAIAKLEEEALDRRTPTERHSDTIVKFIGSLKFLLLHEISQNRMARQEPTRASSSLRSRGLLRKSSAPASIPRTRSSPAESCNQHDRGQASFWVSLESAANAKTIEAWHDHIEQDQGRVYVLGRPGSQNGNPGWTCFALPGK